jgi:thioesterase domain-containing protein
MCQLVHTLSDGPASFAVIVPLIVSGSLDPTLPGKRKGPSLAELAKAYIGVIREQLDFGPCILVGHSFTGILAFEIAHQLLREGFRPDAVSLLLLDTYAWGRSFMRKLMSLSLPMAKMALETRINYLRSRLRSDPSMASKPSQTNHLNADPGVEVCYPSSLDELPPEVFTKVIHNAMKGYSLRPLGCRAVLFRACEVVAWRPFALEHDLGWRGLFTRGLEIVEIPGDHATILKAPHLAMLARQFQERLSAVLANHAQDLLCSSAVEFSPEQAESSLTK